jgi:EAL domain-containing protein (putative c-di-GMP-specific phosphodiesterase class I)
MLSDLDDYAIINGVIRLANAFNLDLSAEGVETN